MSQTLGAPPTNLVPYRNVFNHDATADVDLTSTGTAAPVLVPWDFFMNSTMLTCVFATDVDDVNPEWHLICVDPDAGVVSVISAVSAPLATSRQQAAAGASGLHVHAPVQFDLRSVHKSSRYAYYVVLAALGGLATAEDAYLVDLMPTQEPL
jgi:hypothetical protein